MCVQFTQQEGDDVKMSHTEKNVIDACPTWQTEEEMSRSWREAEGTGAC